MLLTALLALTACGGGEPSATPDPPASSATRPAASSSPEEEAAPACPGAAVPDLEVETIPAPRGGIEAVVGGRGRSVVLLVHGAGKGEACDWAYEVPWLAQSGYRVVAPDLDTVSAETVADVIDRVRLDGARRVAVIGASEGATVAADLAYSGVGSLEAAVALSPAGVQPRGAVPAPPVPLLAAVADGDPDVLPAGFGDLAAHGGDVSTFVARSDNGHGAQLLYLEGGLQGGGGTGSVFRLEMLDFLADHLG